MNRVILYVVSSCLVMLFSDKYILGAFIFLFPIFFSIRILEICKSNSLKGIMILFAVWVASEIGLFLTYTENFGNLGTILLIIHVGYLVKYFIKRR